MQNTSKKDSKKDSRKDAQPSPRTSQLSVETVGNRPISGLYGGHGGMSSLLAGSRTGSNKKAEPPLGAPPGQLQLDSSPQPHTDPQTDSQTDPQTQPQQGVLRSSVFRSGSATAAGIKVLMPTSPSAKTSYPPGTMLQSLESLQEATMRASFSTGSPLHALEDGADKEHDDGN